MSSRRTIATLCAAALVGVSASACTADVLTPGGQAADPSVSVTSASATVEPVSITTNVQRRDVPVDTVLKVSAAGGTLDDVTVTSEVGDLAGDLDTAGTWEASSLLEPGTTYVVKTVATSADGIEQRDRSRFSTADLTLDEQTFASIAPLQGETVGIGMPVIVTFDVPVIDHASMEQHMTVTSTPAQRGSWHWLSDYEVHWRPASYWQAGTDVAVDLDVNSVPAGEGVFGQEDRHVDFHIGDAHIYKVNARTHQMKVWSNGDLLRTIPITTGKEGFTTRSGVKVIIEKFRHRHMNSETVGIPVDSSDGYDLDDVEYAMRLTWSGEFIHAAPWSVASQGYANVSHGCTGMSDANAAWLYAMSIRGDVVEYTGTNRPMTLTNGYGDWNASWADWKAGSAL
jgi:lipoprotein-anchoring transpeptidase ErfK/SrfK